MRCRKFTEQQRVKLSKMDMTISDDGETATMTGRIQIDVVQPENGKNVWVTITMPNGEVLDTMMTADQLVDHD
jgi:flagellar hook assembly protein FlgD